MKHEFNMHGLLHWGHLLLMVGMGLGMAGMIAGPGATFGDGVVQFGLMLGAAALMFVTTGVPAGFDMVHNLMAGNIMPTTYDMGPMMPPGMDTGMGMAGHAGHAMMESTPVLSDTARQLMGITP